MVDRQGPLEPARAVSLILDVVAGLQEAHLNGILHRDVKPSNCFLQADGRVKIGDFGLSKSLVVAGAQLTAPGTFLGTPLFASPEQLRGERLDARTDVYSAAATLYYLLLGRAPFEGGDVVNSLARIVSDPPPPLRQHRPEIPLELERVVLRGLERQRERRWQDLGEFRSALLPFVPGKIPFVGMGIRFGAWLLDNLALYLVLFPLFVGFTWLAVLIGLVTADQIAQIQERLGPVGISLVMDSPFVLYFTCFEGLIGCSLGKWLLGLRVRGEEDGEAPGLGRAGLRALLFVALFSGPGFLAYLFVPSFEEWYQNPDLLWLASGAMSVWNPDLLWLASGAMSVLLVLSTMRARSGFRGPHEWLSGTRVIQLPPKEKRKPYPAGRTEEGLARPAGLPEKLGLYAVRGFLLGSGEERLLLAEDPVLERKVWLWVRPASRPALAERRRQLGRTARSRWLACGEEGDSRWDAFLAPTGGRLSEAITRLGPLSWPEARLLLEELANELADAAEEGTLPGPLAFDQVWLQPNGRLQLVDFSLTQGLPCADQAGQRAALELLGRAAALVLEGRPRAPEATGPVRAPLPLHASRFLHRLLGGPEPYEKVRDFQDDLAATRDKPREVGRSQRAAHLAMLALLPFMGIWFLLFQARASPKVRYGALLSSKMRETSKAWRDMRDEAHLGLAAHLMNPDPWVRLQGAALWAHDMALLERLGELQTNWGKKYSAWRETVFWLQHRWVDLIELVFDPKNSRLAAENQVSQASGAGPGGARLAAEEALATEGRATLAIRAELKADETMIEMGMIWLGVWPAILVLWAFLTRGGFSYRLVGIGLVRGDGRKAGRWQCAARALLFWLPVCVLLLMSYALDCWSWSFGDAHMAGLAAELSWASFVAWILALLLLPAYAVLALRSPTRSLHDRLVGTYLTTQ